MGSDFSKAFNGRNAVITGAANGLGLAIARRMAAGGAGVLLVDADPVVMNRVNEPGLSEGRAIAVMKNLADPDAASVIFGHLARTLGRADILVNNAAWSFHKPILDVTVTEFDRLVHINQRAPFFLAQEFLRQLSGEGPLSWDSAIINIASVNALAGNANLVAYSGTKSALAAMTRAMAVEMKDFFVRVNCISPGPIETSETKRLISTGVVDPPKLLENLLIRRFASCEEVAELVAYLCSPAAAFVNGVNWVIDGGYLA